MGRPLQNCAGFAGYVEDVGLIFLCTLNVGVEGGQILLDFTLTLFLGRRIGGGEPEERQQAVVAAAFPVGRTDGRWQASRRSSWLLLV